MAAHRVAVCSGHMIDRPGRTPERFPPRQERPVASAIAQWLEAWQLGPGDLAICGGASGADILFAEACEQRGLNLRLLLAFPPQKFIETSVRPAGEDWVDRFHALTRRADVRTQADVLGPLPPGANPYERTNQWIIDDALAEHAARYCALLVFDDSRESDGPGGTAHFTSLAARLNPAFAYIVPLHPKGPAR